MKYASDIESWLSLNLIDGLGGESIRRLLIAFGHPTAILSAHITALERIVKKATAHRIKQGPDRDNIINVLKWLEDPVNAVITLADPDYPAHLLNIADPPPLLYFKGRRELLQQPALAVVGSRNATPQGLSNAEAFSEAASNAGLCIISGMALGIDTAAHHGGLRGSAASIAIVGTGLDIVYPAKNHPLAHKLAKEGALISEFPLGTPAIGRNFPRRNRIISGMTQGCLVVEAALQSGSLITARQALEQGREVMAIPGSIHSPLSKGCHALIKQGAKLVENTQDILDELSHLALIDTPSDRKKESSPGQSTENSLLLSHLGYDTVNIDTLCARSGLTAEVVSAMLLTLELDGQISSLPGGWYQRID
ncbi:DNA protecting protein DprA [Nitrosomonas ureae]|uniref:DNA protecting protein DprA n=1 Tax=Nitrosomonas ureae TaxID=44577 RepID=A0A285C132_9PROT|nr:DNA-processing protein DprA [Nitrosomonas ureae]SNX60743.1 DNA protecting protein DprA [Nitrosomonas ureae]